uniref:BZIP domain-containing protein n=1 Tax=Brassica oleracea var. oleracea TaxID=109376 RepID=A0A0D3BY21_BRAOL
MHIVFSIDDLTDSFWPATPPVPSPEQTTVDGMTRSQSEWAFQRLLKENSGSDQTNAIDRLSPPVQSLSTVDETGDVVEIQKPPRNHQGSRKRAPSSDPAGVDADQYHAILKSKPDLACAAVYVGTVEPEDSSASSSVNQNQSQPPQGSVVAQTSPGASSVRSVPSTSIQKKLDVPARQATSISSRDDSDDDDLDGDADNGDPTDVKRARRMLSNRESARRSRRRKQEQMNEFDTQVGQLRGEHSTLLSRLSDMNHKCDAAAVDNRILRADIETLRTKVKMVEETVKRVTGVNPLHWARPNMGTPLNNTPIDSSRILPNSNHMLEPAIPSTTNAGLASNQRVERANLLLEQVNREGMQNQFAINPNLY